MSSSKRMSRCLTALFAAGGFAVAAVPAGADEGGCKSASITGQSGFDPASGAFVGGGIIVLSDHEENVQWASVILGMSFDTDGTIHLAGSHHFTTENGGIDFTTMDDVVAVPTSVPGEYDITNHLEIIEGHGRVKSGELEAVGVLDFFAGAVVIEASSGTFCAEP